MREEAIFVVSSQYVNQGKFDSPSLNIIFVQLCMLIYSLEYCS